MAAPSTVSSFKTFTRRLEHFYATSERGGGMRGLKFTETLSQIGHDVNGIFEHGGLKEAEEMCFLPRTHGKANLDKDAKFFGMTVKLPKK